MIATQNLQALAEMSPDRGLGAVVSAIAEAPELAGEENLVVASFYYATP